MKSTCVYNTSDNNDEYPCLRISKDNVIVLFRSNTQGTIVYSENSKLKLGDNYSTWDSSSFSPFNGKVELES